MKNKDSKRDNQLVLSGLEPASFPRRVLLAVTGLSPQVVTETLYALSQVQQPAYVPTEIHVITTMEGKEQLRLALLGEQRGQFHDFCDEYGHSMEKIDFSAANIHVLTDKAGNMLSDIRTEEENIAAADFITSTLAEFTQDPNCALHVSIAGGRKTMGFYLGYALSLCGRMQDRLSHVLVNSPFESEPQFYFPPSKPKVISLSRAPNRSVSTADARITLADIPFVRLSNRLLPGGLDWIGGAGFEEIVTQVQKSLEPPKLQFDWGKEKIYAAGVEILKKSDKKIGPKQRAYYLFHALRAKQESGPIRGIDIDGEQFLECYGFFTEVGRTYYKNMEETIEKEGGISVDFPQQAKSDINKALRDALKEDLAQPYLIQGEGAHYLGLSSEQIEL